MKAKLLLIPVAAFLIAASADLGFGVDVDSGPYNPYYYGNGYYGYPWGNVGWDWDYPLYSPPIARPPRPPMTGIGPGPARPPQNNNQPQVRPPMNGIPTTAPNGSMRPGNGGLPSVTVPSTPPRTPGSNNNSQRGR